MHSGNFYDYLLVVVEVVVEDILNIEWLRYINKLSICDIFEVK